MTFSPESLARELAALQKTAVEPSRYVVAFSGGLDSTVLLHALSELRQSIAVAAVHIDHALHQDSSAWEQHCRRIATALGVEFESIAVRVQLESGRGPEAAAREARYAALLGIMQRGDWLLSAHHCEDQAETLLLNLIRGSGPAGIAGIGGIRHFGPGWLARPLLNTNRGALEDYAMDNGLRWIEDPTNKDRQFDRNYLRHDALPRLKTRWHDISARLQRSAAHAGEASQLLSELASIDLQRLGGRSERLPIDQLSRLSPHRQRNLIRFALRELGLSTPTTTQLGRVLNEVIPARDDAQPLVSWSGTAVRRYRNGLYLLPQNPVERIVSSTVQGGAVWLGAGLGTLVFRKHRGSGLSDAVVRAGLSVRSREGGEKIRPQSQSHTKKLKKLLQEEGVVPWMRDRVPLVYCGDELVAVADLWMAADAVSEAGTAVHWEGRPALH